MKPHTRRCQRRVRYGHGHVAQITFFGEGLTCFFLFFFGDTIIPNFPRPPPTPSSPLSRPRVYSRECMRSFIYLAASVCLVSLEE